MDQDGRLTGKHIRTLLHLQDLHTENDLLKARIAELELEEAKAARCDLLEREVEKLRVRLCEVSLSLYTVKVYSQGHFYLRLTFHNLPDIVSNDILLSLISIDHICS